MEFYDPNAFLTMLRQPSPKKRQARYDAYRAEQQQQLRQWILANAQRYTEKRPMRARQIARDTGAYPYHGGRNNKHYRADICERDLHRLLGEGLILSTGFDMCGHLRYDDWIANPDYVAFKQVPPTSPVAPAQSKDDLATVLQPRRRSGQNAN